MTTTENPTENPHVTDWIAALRSGDYAQNRQGAMRLNRHGETVGYCCLGVAGDLAGCDFVRADSDPYEGLTYYGFEGHNDSDGDYVSAGHLPVWLREILGLSEQDEETLALSNDTGSSFDAIADMLERWNRAGRTDLVGAD
jgi:hypothetical protein